MGAIGVPGDVDPSTAVDPTGLLELDGVRVDDAATQSDSDAQDGDDLADRRDEVGDQRDTSAHNRDVSGRRRDEALDLLDDEADRDDTDALERDLVAIRRIQRFAGHGIDPQLAEQTAADRECSRHDRERAARDRYASAVRRVEAQLDRSTAKADRTAAHGDRSRSRFDRGTALTNRRNAAVDRGIATFDELTGTYRRGPGLVELARELARSIRTSEALVLVFVDVDGLKVVNDSLGHEAGDSLLTQVANVLAACLRPYDVVVRFGGDEFLCFCQGMTDTDADARLAAVNAELARSGWSISYGVADARPGDTAASLIARADRALYRGRESRRGRGVSEPPH